MTTERKSLRQVLSSGVVREFPVSYVKNFRLREDYDSIVLFMCAYTRAMFGNIKPKARFY